MERTGGGGGGAILIGAAGALTLSGTIRANGGWAGYYWGAGCGGSGGAIRVIADAVWGTGALRASGDTGGNGRIRVETNQSDWAFASTPAFTYDAPGTDPQIWLPADKPRVRIVSLGGVPVPADPRAGATWAGVDAYLADSGGSKTLVIQAEHVPLTWNVRARLAPMTGPATVVNATYVSGDETLSTWQADLALGLSYTAIQVRASVD